MFCPEGFRLFTDHLEVCSDASAIRAPVPPDYKSPMMADGRVDWENCKSFAQSVWHEWIQAKYLTKQNTRIFACSTAGQVQEVSLSAICCAQVIASDFNPKTSNTGSVEYFLASKSFYPLIDTDSWCFDLKEAFLALSEADPQKTIDAISTRDEPSGYDESDIPELFRKIERFNSFKPALTLSHMDGWALCIKDEHFISDSNKLLEYVESSINDEKKSGRPPKKHKVLDAYRAVYPEGHGANSWKKVCLEVERKAGIPVSTTTLKRALGIRDD